MHAFYLHLLFLRFKADVTHYARLVYEVTHSFSGVRPSHDHGNGSFIHLTLLVLLCFFLISTASGRKQRKKERRDLEIKSPPVSRSRGTIFRFQVPKIACSNDFGIVVETFGLKTASKYNTATPFEQLPRPGGGEHQTETPRSAVGFNIYMERKEGKETERPGVERYLYSWELGSGNLRRMGEEVVHCCFASFVCHSTFGGK